MSNGNTVVLDRSVAVAVAAVLAALWFWKTHTKKRAPAAHAAAAIVWEEGIVFPKQHLWKGIASYSRTPGPPGACGPVLAFRSEKAGLGDPVTMAAITARFRPRPTDLHVVTYPKARASHHSGPSLGSLPPHTRFRVLCPTWLPCLLDADWCLRSDVMPGSCLQAGTSWIQEVAWLVNHGADLEGSRSTPSGQRTVYIELSRPGVDKLAVRQLRHHLGPSLTHLSPSPATNPPFAVRCVHHALLGGGHADGALIGGVADAVANPRPSGARLGRWTAARQVAPPGLAAAASSARVWPGDLCLPQPEGHGGVVYA